MVIKLILYCNILRPYFWGGYVRGGRLTRHLTIDTYKTTPPTNFWCQESSFRGQFPTICRRLLCILMLVVFFFFWPVWKEESKVKLEASPPQKKTNPHFVSQHKKKTHVRFVPAGFLQDSQTTKKKSRPVETNQPTRRVLVAETVEMMLWSLVLWSGLMELAYGATSMDKTVQHKLTKVREEMEMEGTEKGRGYPWRGVLRKEATLDSLVVVVFLNFFSCFYRLVVYIFLGSLFGKWNL